MIDSLIHLNFISKNELDINGNGKDGNISWILIFILYESLKNLYLKGIGG
jgi:hypothetical protein